MYRTSDWVNGESKLDVYALGVDLEIEHSISVVYYVSVQCAASRVDIFELYDSMFLSPWGVGVVVFPWCWCEFFCLTALFHMWVCSIFVFVL